MKHTTRLIITAAMSAAAIAGLSSCQHKELCYDHAHSVYLDVDFNWSRAPHANPESMSLYLFPRDGREPLRYEFIGRDGGRIKVPVGTYDAICLNSDTEGIYYRETGNFESFEITTRSTDILSSGLTGLVSRTDNVPRVDGTENERIALPADSLWSASRKTIFLRMADTSASVTMYPAYSVCNYRVEIVNGENLKYTSGISAALSTLSGGIRPGTGELTTETVTVPFGMSVSIPEEGQDAGKEIVSGEMLTFGHCPATDAKHTLIVYAILADGSKYSYTYDADEVTRQIHSAPDQRNITIRLDGLPLPAPITNGGGFHPEVEDWDEIEIGLEM